MYSIDVHSHVGTHATGNGERGHACIRGVRRCYEVELEADLWQVKPAIPRVGVGACSPGKIFDFRCS